MDITSQFMNDIVNSTPSEGLKIDFFSTAQRILLTLAQREEDILRRRFRLLPDDMHRYTLEDIGNIYHITRERVRQLEVESIRKLQSRKHEEDILAVLEALLVSMTAIIHKYGGVVEENFLEDALFNQHKLPETEKQPSELTRKQKDALHFLISHMVAGDFERMHLDAYHPSWKMKQISWEPIDEAINHVIQLVEKENRPVAQEELFQLLREKSSFYGDMSEKLLHALEHVREDIVSLEHVLSSFLRLSKKLKLNLFQEWGMAHWTTITPKRINDKIYLVMKKTGKPLHFSEITNLINELKFDHKEACSATVHNELILDPKYVLVGRGIYALCEWGYKHGNVVEVVASLLRKHGTLPKEKIVQEVQKQRLVKDATVGLALMKREFFAKLPTGEYTLAAQPGATKGEDGKKE